MTSNFVKEEIIFFMGYFKTQFPIFFENKCENTSNIFRCILRTVGGGLIYFGLNEVLKLPFPKELLDAGNVVSQLIRVLRYAAVIFTVIGVYPMLFKLTDKIWSKKKQEPEPEEEPVA